jgi:hypothetical protein
VSEGINTLTGGVVGGGNPAGDLCNAVTDPAVETLAKPVTEALKGIGHGILDQITTWVSEGAGWLIGKVAAEIDHTTTPELTSKGFLAEYRQMAEIAAVLAAAMLLLAVFEAIAQSSWGILGRAVFVSVPLAFLATSVAFVVVQLLLVATDAMCHAIAVATKEHSEHFFKSALTDLSKVGSQVEGGISAGNPVSEGSGAVTPPLFVTFLAAIIGAFAAFFVWLELVMRDAAVYVVALFMPMALAASIWPRWSGALRRTGELVVVVIASKFVIVSVIALAAGLVGEEGAGVEHVLAASALMLLACFAPFVLFKLVPFAEGAMSAAYGRRSASGGAVSALQIASDVQMIRHMARSNWGPPEVWKVKGEGSGGAEGTGGSGGRPSGGRPGGGAAAKSEGAASGAGKGAAAGAGAAEAAAPAAAAAAVPAAAVKGAKSGAQRLQQSGTARAAGEAPTASAPQSRAPTDKGATGAPAETPHSQSPAPQGPAEQPPRPPQEPGTKPTKQGKK